MRMSWIDPAYEAARMWALHPISHPPSRWAQLLRGGIATWVRQTHPPMASPSLEQKSAHLSVSPLLTIVAAMIAEVCQ